MTKVINESGLYFGLYFKRIFSIKNILFSVIFSFLTMMLFMSVTIILHGWGDIFCLVDPLIISISVIFVYLSLGKSKFHKKDKEYLLINLIFFVLLSFLLSIIVFGMIILTNYIYDFTENIYYYSWKMFFYINLLLTLTIFFICSILSKLIIKEKDQVILFMSLALLIFMCGIMFWLSHDYTAYKVEQHDDLASIKYDISKELEGFNVGMTKKSFLWILLPWNTFIVFLRVLFYSDSTNSITFFQMQEGWCYVWISQYVWLFVLTFINIVLFKYKESGA